jgi:hypothetical protein
MKNALPGLIVLSLFLAFPATAQSFLERLLGVKTTNSPALSVSALTQEEVANALREALGQGAQQAVARLGREGGFLKDRSVRIPMPASLQKVERTLRLLKQDRLADEFVATLNRAAEQAVPEAASVLSDSVRQLSVADAHQILTATNNAATAYFRRTSEAQLHERFLPIVREATEQAGVTAAYKRMTQSVNVEGLSLTSFLGESADLDGYVTRKTLDGLFLKISEEEQRIRSNPVARTSALLQKVFGSVIQPAPVTSPKAAPVAR